MKSEAGGKSTGTKRYNETDDLYLWVRLGDGGNYEHFGDDFTAVAGHLKEFNVREPIVACRGGIECPGFDDQHNYISLYWGDKDSNHVRDLRADELTYLRSQLQTA